MEREDVSERVRYHLRVQLPASFKHLFDRINVVGRLIAREQVTYGEPAPSEETKELAKAIGEVSRQARGVLLLFLTVVAYSVITLASIRDAVFYAQHPNLKLPVVGVSVSASAFFAVAPVLVALLNVYLQLYLAELRRYERQALRINRPGVELRYVFPWIATLGMRPGPFSFMVRLFYAGVAWVLAPFVCLEFAERVMLFRSSPVDWFFGNHVPSATALATFAVLDGLVMATWWAMSLILTRRITGKSIRSTRIAVVFAMPLLIGSVWIANEIAIHRAQATAGDEEYRGPRVDLRNAALSVPAAEGHPEAVGPDLIGVTLDHADMAGCYLENAVLRDARLNDARLSSAVLSGSVFERAQLRHTFLTHAQCDEASFAGAEMDGAIWQEASIAYAYMAEASCVNCFFDHVDARLVKTEGGRFEGADFFDTKLQGAKLNETKFEGASFKHSDVSGASFRDAHLEAANFEGATLIGVNFSGAHLEGASFREATIQGCDFTDAHLAASTLPLSDETIVSKDIVLVSLPKNGESYDEANKRAPPHPAMFGGKITDPRTIKTLKERSGKAADFTGAIIDGICGEIAGMNMIGVPLEQQKCADARRAEIDKLRADRRLKRMMVRKFLERR